MAVITVTGEISADKLGVTLAHEHIISDTSKDYREPPESVKAFMREYGISLEEGVTLRNFGLLMREPQWSVDNQILSSYDDALEELAVAKRAVLPVVTCTSARLICHYPSFCNLARTRAGKLPKLPLDKKTTWSPLCSRSASMWKIVS